MPGSRSGAQVMAAVNRRLLRSREAVA